MQMSNYADALEGPRGNTALEAQDGVADEPVYDQMRSLFDDSHAAVSSDRTGSAAGLALGLYVSR